MGAGRGKVVEIKRHNLVANSDFANMGEVTQYHDHDEYLKLTDKQFRDFKLGRVTPTLKREGILEIMTGEVFENNRDMTRDVLDNVRSAGDAYAEALNTVRTLNKIKDTGITQVALSDENTAGVLAAFNTKVNTLTVFENAYNDNYAEFEDYDSDAFSASGASITDIIIHEFGHSVHETLGKPFDDFADRTIELDAVSHYGSASPTEAFAEAFNLYVTGKKPQQGEEYYREFEKFMKDQGLTKFKNAMPTLIKGEKTNKRSKKVKDTATKGSYDSLTAYAKDRHKFSDYEKYENDKKYGSVELARLEESGTPYKLAMSEFSLYMASGEMSDALHGYYTALLTATRERAGDKYNPEKRYIIPIPNKQAYITLAGLLGKDSVVPLDTKPAKKTEKPKPVATPKVETPKVETPKVTKPKKPKATKEVPKPEPKPEPKPVDRLGDLVAKYSKYKTTSTLTKDYKAGKITQAEYNHVLNALGKNTKSAKKAETPAKKVENTPKATETKVKKETKKSTVAPTKEQKKPTTSKKVEPKKRKSNIKNTYSDMNADDFNSAVDDLLNRYK